VESFSSSFDALTGHQPFPWQRALFERLVAADFPQVCSIPTGIGKTSAIAVWLLALATRAETGSLRGFPRRLVYVVNRRTVVDQATADVETWRRRIAEEPALGDTRATLQRLAVLTGGEAIAVSTLRGQRADNAEWRIDPARPAIVIGTVDMIGSRLLFGGYGCGFRSKPLHAGFLGQDVWLVHDEAHLEPAFQQLLTAVRSEQETSGDVRPFLVTALTATSRDGAVDLRLTADDLEHEVVAARLHARKALALHHEEQKALVDAVVARVLEHRESGQAILVYLRTVEDVDRVCDRLRDANVTVEQLTGTLRGFERDRLVAENRVFKRFAPAASAVEPAQGTVCLVCTSAGEVGINMSADHMVCDLTPFDSMAQRLGRVNRFGNGAAYIDVVVAGLRDNTDGGASAPEDPYAAARARTAALLAMLPIIERTPAGIDRRDASPAALEALPLDARREAFTPGPVALPARDVLFDKWALTTVRGTLPGRPPLEEWLHGIAPWDPPETTVAWRMEVEKITGPLLDEHPADDLLELYPLKPHELLRDRTDRVFTHLEDIADREPDKPVWLIDDDDSVEVLTFKTLVEKGAAALAYCTVLLPPSAGGLALDESRRPTGRLSGRTAAEQSESEIAYDVADSWLDEQGRPRRRRVWNSDPVPEGMRLVRTIAIETSSTEEDGEPVVDVWRWFTRPVHADDEGSRTGLREQPLDEHLVRAEAFATALAERLQLDGTEASAVRMAARLHDLGKARAVWQRSIRNLQYPEKVLAKSGNVLPLRSLSSYRHELGSLIDVRGRSEFQALPPAAQDLLLHLVAAHHGRARPAFRAHEVHDPERLEDAAAAAARDAMARYGRLQRRYGRWGLAFLESLLRAADILASDPAMTLPAEGGEIPQHAYEPTRVVDAPAVLDAGHTWHVNVDPRNPGEFLACCGLLEVAHRLDPGAEAWFDDGVFRVRSDTRLPDIVHALIREEAEELTLLNGNLAVQPLIAPLKLALTDGPRGTLVLDGWMTVRVEKGKVIAGANRPWNFWSGQQTSLRIWRSLRAALRQQIASTHDLLGDAVFARRVPLSGRFGFDPGAAWNALDVGFSPNEQGIDVASSPAVELFAAVGLQRFRPIVADDRETFWYSTWTTPLPPCVAAAACTGRLPSGGRSYRGVVVSRGSYAALGISIPVERTSR